MRTWALGAIIAAFLAVGTLIMLSEERSLIASVETVQTGFRGTGMEVGRDLDRLRELMEANVAPEPPWELDTSGETVAELGIYENVQILGDLTDDQFNRFMAAITEWVSPDQGCAYCHNEENLASDEVYAKVVSRRMIQMTRHINTEWADHVAGTGVTCYTCHRGMNVPANIWFDGDAPETPPGWAGYTGGQNKVSVQAGYTSMYMDPFSRYLSAPLGEAKNIRIETRTVLPQAEDDGISLQDTEGTYSLMIHMSTALGANCTLCHNTRDFSSWEQATPQRVTAWHGLQMVRNLNADYLTPLGPVYPEHRLGPAGDAPKANCATCHIGVQKPLNGAPMADDYPSLKVANPEGQPAMDRRMDGRGQSSLLLTPAAESAAE